MKTKWNLLLVFILLAALVGGTTTTAQAQETHYFNWDPPAPQEGMGTVTFTATPPDGYASLEWSRSASPGGASCDLPMEDAGVLSVRTVMLQSGDYQVCLKITLLDNTTIDDTQLVTVTNLPPVLSNPTVTPATTIAGYPITTASVTFADWDSGLTCTIDFGDGTDPVTGTMNGSTCSLMLHVYTTAGTYTVTFTVSEPGVEPVTASATHTVVEPYATDLFGTGGTVQNPESAFHAPDGIYASIRSSSAIGLALSAPVEGAALTVYHSTRSPSCTVFFSEQAIGATTSGADHSVFAVPALAGPQQVFAIQCGTLGKKAVFELDAIRVEPISVPAGYVTWVVPVAGDVQNPGAAVGLPDQIYATIPETGGTIVLGMDTPMQQGILTIYHSTDSPACQVIAAAMENPLPIGTTLPGASSTSLILSLPPGYQSSYFAIQCADKTVFKLDAVQFQLSAEPTGYAAAAGFYLLQEYQYIVGPGQDPGAATGAPDGLYATTSSQSSGPGTAPGIAVDMGDMVQGAMLTVYHSAKSASCLVMTVNDLSEPVEMLGNTAVEANSSIFAVSQDFRYILIVCNTGGVLELDAVYLEGTAEFSGYAISVLDVDASVKDPTSAVGAPDGKYATVPALTGDILLDLGMQFSGLLTITHPSGSPACHVYVTEGSMGSGFTEIGYLTSGLNYTILPISPQLFPIGIRYVGIDCVPVQKGTLSLDAVKVELAPEPTGNGLVVTAISGSVQNQVAALGAPDGLYATIGYPGGDIGLYIGASSTGTLTVYHSTTSPSCTIAFGNADGSYWWGGTTTAGTAFTTIDLPDTNISFVGVSCSALAKKASFQLDAVQVTSP